MAIIKEIEEKARRYDEALKRAKNHYSTTDSSADIKLIGLIFPELKESEDEKMIQYFKDLAPFDNADELYEKYGFSHKDAIAWLEKQDEHANFRNKIQVGDKVTRNEDGVLVNLSQLNRVAKKDEKQGEQKPAEWSEECCINQLIVFCENCMVQDSNAKKCASFLKSLKERYTWKPSETQLETLKELSHDIPTKRGIIEEILIQLKQL